MTPAEIRAEAEKYAGVKFEGHNPLGKPVYSSESVGRLLNREPTMDAFTAGYLAGARKMNEECANFVLLRPYASMTVSRDGVTAVWEGESFEMMADDIRSLLPQGEGEG